jgi:hypothetical protein
LSDPEFPTVDLGYELRFTGRALRDLRCEHLAPGDLDEIEETTPWAPIVREFRQQRGTSPYSTRGSLRNMGRGDIYPLHGPAGGRAATWFDPDSDVCWLVGFTPQHDYTLLEERAAAGDLLPSEDDETLLELEREELDFALRVQPGLQRLVAAALQQPGQPARGTIGRLLRLEVSAVVVEVDGSTLVDLALILHLPVIVAGAVTPPDWPGQLLLETLAGLATGEEWIHLDLDYSPRVPTPTGDRPLDRSAELCIKVTNWVP